MDPWEGQQHKPAGPLRRPPWITVPQQPVPVKHSKSKEKKGGDIVKSYTHKNACWMNGGESLTIFDKLQSCKDLKSNIRKGKKKKKERASPPPLFPNR